MPVLEWREGARADPACSARCTAVAVRAKFMNGLSDDPKKTGTVIGRLSGKTNKVVAIKEMNEAATDGWASADMLRLSRHPLTPEGSTGGIHNGPADKAI